MTWSRLILGVDLWDVFGDLDVNLIRHDASAPSISSTVPHSYPTPPMPRGPRQHTTYPYHQLHTAPAYVGEPNPIPSPNAIPPTAMTPSQPPNSSSTSFDRSPAYPPHHPHRFNGHYQNGYSNGMQQHSTAQETAASPAQDLASGGCGRAELSKNLIGQCHSSVQKLEGIDGKIGLYFIFQDMSVRTEGWFRLRCNLFALGNLGFEGEEPVDPLVGDRLFNEAPCLAATFSKPFKVFSAKKFPGVVETTLWSEKFAGQGIKIPIRKGDSKGKGKKRARGDDSEDEDDEVDDGE